MTVSGRICAEATESATPSALNRNTTLTCVQPHSGARTPITFTRPALYERVWTEPIRTVAGSLGVSDVGLAKACCTAGIPAMAEWSAEGKVQERRVSHLGRLTGAAPAGLGQVRTASALQPQRR